MTLQELQAVLKLAEPYRQGNYCLGAEHDAVTVGLKDCPPDAVTAELEALGCALSWVPDDDGEIEDEDNPFITCFV